MATPIRGNGHFTRIENVSTIPSELISSYNTLSGVNEPFPVLNIAGGVTVAGNVTITANQCSAAASEPMGLQLAGGPTGIVTLVGTTNADMASLQLALGLTAAGQSKILRFFYLDAPTGDHTLATTAGGWTSNTFGGGTLNLFQATDVVAGASSRNNVEILVTATSVTAAAETCTGTILKSAAIGGEVLADPPPMPPIIML